jgi:MFS family permease
MGWQGTSMTIGSGLGAPLAGFATDRWGPGAGYVAAGAVGIGLAALAGGIALSFAGRRTRPARPAPGDGGHDASSGAGERNTGAPVRADTLVD